MPDGRGPGAVIAFVASALLGLWPLAALAQDINPDRPDLTTSAELVPAGALQLETGLEYERERVGGGPTRQQLTTQAVLRAGLLARLEVSLEGEPFVWQRAGDDARGSGDYTLALKYRLYAPPEGGDTPSVALALRPFVKLPVARAPIGSERPDAGALLLVSLGLPWGLGLDLNAGVAAIGQTRPEGFIPQGAASASLSWRRPSASPRSRISSSPRRRSATAVRACARRWRWSTSSRRAWPSTPGCAPRLPDPARTGRPSSA
jgi:hypothetical protein